MLTDTLVWINKIKILFKALRIIKYVPKLKDIKDTKVLKFNRPVILNVPVWKSIF